jgi:hypothetical protein
MEGEKKDEQETYDKSFIDEPAILDKHKAAGVITQGKYLALNYQYGKLLIILIIPV